MNLIPRPKPVTLRKRLTLAVVNAVLFTAPLAIAMHLPISMTYTAPEHSASAVVQADQAKAQRQYDRAMEKCQALPAGTLPGGAVIDWTGDRPTSYTVDPDQVDAAFRVALGE
jgi:hypothetical protein